MSTPPSRPRRAVIEAFGHILLSVGPSGCFYPVPDLLKPHGKYTPEPAALIEAIQDLTDNGYAERYSCDGTTMIRFTLKGVALAKAAIRIHEQNSAACRQPDDSKDQ